MFILTIVLAGALVSGQTIAEVPRTFVKTGRYNPQLFGVSGRYMPDNRGKYQHIPVPYDGGYGDRGEKYDRDADWRARYWQQNGENGSWEEPDSYADTAPYAESPYKPASSVPNYITDETGSDYQGYAQDYQNELDGWRIIQFKWIKDGKTRYSYLYETENKYLADEIGKLARLRDNILSVRVDGFYQYQGDDGTIYGVDYVANEKGFSRQEKNIQNSIEKVLDFLTQNATKGLVA